MPDDVRLRIEQERKEIIATAKRARQAAKAIEKLRQEIVDYWCNEKGSEAMSKQTLNVMASFAVKYGSPALFEWISIAMDRLGRHKSDSHLGRYICGIKNRILSEMEGTQQ